MKIFKSKLPTYSLIVSTALVAAACGGGGGGTAALATMEDCYQLTAGQSFRATNTPNIPTYTLNGINYSYISTSNETRIVDQTVNGKAYKVRGVATPNWSSPSSAGLTYLDITSGRYERARAASASFPSGATNITSITEYSNFVRNLSVNPGQSQTVTYTSMTTPVTNGVLGVAGSPISITATLTFVGLETITTSSGTYMDTCKQTLSISGSDSRNTDTFWYAKGYGNVKEIVTSYYTDGRIPSTVTRTIQ